ncbi:MAG: TIGR04283 family arsenosugar biosynthesis glycosyltransferase [Cyanobacteria bacterium P01_C01_bin.89]
MPLSKPLLSVIVPVWREADKIEDALKNLYSATEEVSYEIIVVDGDYEGSTLKVIEPFLQSTNASILVPTHCVISEKGRGNQMNCGAKKAIAPILLFLHVDTKLPPRALEKILFKLNQSDEIVAGAFDLVIESPQWIFTVISKISSWRSRITRIPYGDQGIFIRREIFEAVGGFENIPIMEDVTLMRLLKKQNMKICFLSDPVSTSARRWEREGIVQCTLRNWCLITLYFCGVKPQVLSRFYK